jgi:predicted phage terminase large subunit-like protein
MTAAADNIQHREDALRRIAAMERMRAAALARERMIPYTKFMMPDLEHPEDATKSDFEEGLHHHLIADALERLEKGVIRRLIITTPPRHTKSELCTRKFPTFCMGRHPNWEVIVTGYSQEFAEQEFGKPIRDTMESPAYAQVFPGSGLKKGSKSASFMETNKRGKISIVGAGGALTGKGADLLVIDDPVKNAEEADSQQQREALWSWYTSTARSRLLPGGRILIVMTRWHEDDLVGRILAGQGGEGWEVLHLPALCEDPHNDPLKRPLGAALWPEWYPREELLAIKADITTQNGSRWWNALYQGNPTPDDGNFIKANYIKTYMPKDLPKSLRYYAASDHAVSTDQARDATVIIVVGVDEFDNIFVVDCWWERKETDDVVDAMLMLMKKWRPIIWWAEKGHISKSIGPFLRKRMREESTYINIEEVTPVKDKKTRAQSIQGRMSMGKVFLPAFAPWFEAARNELLKFPLATHDDFVDALAWIGLGLAREVPAGRKKADAPENKPKTGTWGWLKAQMNSQKRRDRFAQAKGGM